MSAFGDRALSELLDDVAAQSPSPGGGGCAAWACAMGAGLAEMAAAFTLARPRYADVHERMAAIRVQAGELRSRACELAEHDSEGYAPVLAALQLPPEHPERAQRLADALSAAAETPLAAAEVAAAVAELAAEVARTGNAHLTGDAVTGALLAEAACRAASRLVEINLAGRTGDPRLERLAEAVSRAGAARDEALRPRDESSG